MQKLLFTVACFFFPIFIFSDFQPILQLIVIYLVYVTKVIISLLILSLIAGIWSVKALFKFLFGGLRFQYGIELAISIGICFIAFSYAKYKLKNILQHSLQLLHVEHSLITNLQNINSDRIQVIAIIKTIQKMINATKENKLKKFSIS